MRGRLPARALIAACALALSAACAGAAPRPTATGVHACNAPAACLAACDGGADDACVRLMWMTPPDTDPAELARVRAAVDRSCGRGAARSCALVAHTWCEIDGGGIGGCTRDAIDRFRRACDAGDGFGCEGLAAVHQRGGEGIPRSVERTNELSVRAARLFAAACDRGSLYDCLEAALVERAKKLGRATFYREEAPRLAARACDDGDALACNVLGRTDRACALGLSAACP